MTEDMTNQDSEKRRVSKEVSYAILEIFVALIVAASTKILLGEDPFANAASIIIGSVGLLLGFHRLVTIFETTKSIGNLSEKVASHGASVTNGIKETETRISNDISKLSSRIGLTEIGELYDAIDEEFSQDKSKIIRSTHDQLRDLKDSEESAPLAKAAFYKWIHENLSRLEPGDSLFAVSLMKDAEWEDNAAERRFLRQNITIAEHGVIVDRIFVADSVIWEDATHQESLGDELAINAGRVVRRHFASKEPQNLRGYHADASSIKASDPALMERIGDGFIMLRFARTGDRVALLDDYTDPAIAAGKVTKSVRKLDELETAFAELRGMCQEL